MRRMSEYTFEELTELVADESKAVIVHIPVHVVMVFGTGCDDSGKHRHVLVGRPAGGQSPTGWIPFTEQDAYEGTTGWVNNISVSPSGVVGSIDGKHGLCMHRPNASSAQLNIDVFEFHPAMIGRTIPDRPVPIPPWLRTPVRYSCARCLVGMGVMEPEQYYRKRAQIVAVPSSDSL